ncbi:MAG: Ig-like domain-containing protein, partial [Clostridiales Family XIII bacterium]|nr:Ig-like domain-containing protein [Clostridiales Family XIII bacterium]
LNLTNCSFIGNKAVNYGGAISSEGAKVYATNCTFYNNSSSKSGSYGGAIYLYSSATNVGGGAITNCTLVGNTAKSRGGGIIHDGTTNTANRITVKNSLIIGNSAGTGADIYTATDGGRNLYGTANGTFSKLATSTSSVAYPNTWIAAGAPQDNGGNHLPTIALLDVTGSPAIDKLTAGSGAPATDQRGMTRGATPDIGAYEFIAAPSPTVTSVTVTPDEVSVVKGESRTFTAEVEGTNDPVQTVDWSVSGNSSADTTISAGGLLTVAADETATSLTVTATSTCDDTKSGVAAVTVASAFHVSTAEEFNHAMSKAGNALPIYIEADIAGVSNDAIAGGGRDITIYGQGHTITQAGGGVTAHVDGANNKLTIKDLTIDGAGSTTTNKNGGGAIYLGGGDVYLENVTIKNCSVTFVSDVNNGLRYGGGAVSVALHTTPNGTASNGKITAINCTFTGNNVGHTYDAPGGGALSADKVDITNCTFWGNRATDSMGGAVYARMGGSLVNCTVINNFAGVSGGGVATRTEPVNGGYSYLHILNSIVAANTTGGTMGKSAVNVDHVYDQGGNIFGYIHTAANADYRDEVYSANGKRKPAAGSVWNVAVDGNAAWLDYAGPKDNGGKTPTIALKDAAASPAIDKGAPYGAVESYYTALNAPAVDQRGESRNGAPDIGAYEFAGTRAPVVNYTPKDTPGIASPDNVDDGGAAGGEIPAPARGPGGNAAKTGNVTKATPGAAFVNVVRTVGKDSRNGSRRNARETTAPRNAYADGTADGEIPVGEISAPIADAGDGGSVIIAESSTPQTPGDDTEGSGFPSGYLMYGVAALVLAGGLLWFILAKLRKS